MNLTQTTLVALILSLAFNIEAKTYKCTTKDGKTSYGTSPCKADQNEGQISGNVSSIGFKDGQGDNGGLVMNKQDKKLRDFYLKQLEFEYSKPLKQPQIIRNLQNAISDIDNRQVGVAPSAKQANQRSLEDMNDEFRSEKARLESEKFRIESEMRNKQMQHQNEIHRMENQQRLNQAFPPIWTR